MFTVQLNSGYQQAEAKLLHDWSDTLEAGTVVGKTVLYVKEEVDAQVVEYLDMRHNEIRNQGLPTQAICSLKRHYNAARGVPS